MTSSEYIIINFWIFFFLNKVFLNNNRNLGGPRTKSEGAKYTGSHRKIFILKRKKILEAKKSWSQFKIWGAPLEQRGNNERAKCQKLLHLNTNLFLFQVKFNRIWLNLKVSFCFETNRNYSWFRSKRTVLYADVIICKCYWKY